MNDRDNQERATVGEEARREIESRTIYCTVLRIHLHLTISIVCLPGHVILSYAMLCHIMLCYVMLCHIMLCYAMLRHTMLCYVMLCHIM